MILFVVSFAYAKVGGGDVRFEAKGIGNVTFSHDVHVNKAKLTCLDCHAQLYTTSRDAPRKAVTMAQMQKGESCGACHSGKKTFDVKANCTICHKK
jgi:c(7)-type cytochrome triheme protein